MPLGGALTAIAIGGAAAGAGKLIGGMIGQDKASGDFQNANEAAHKAMQQLIGTGMPPDLARQVILQQYKSAGKLNPELEQALSLGPSEVAGIKEDPKLREAQMQALQQMQQAGHTGQTAQDQLNNLKMQNQVNADNRSRQASILQNAQARGQGGAGATLAAQLQSAQGNANLASEQGLQLAAQANNARMNALAQSAGLGGQMRGQDFNVNQAKASAADQFQRFNIQNQQAVANQNVQAKNQAQAGNLSNDQNISNMNVGQNNQEAERMNQARLQDWQSNNQRNSIIAGGYKGQSDQYNQQGNQVANQYTQMGGGIGGMIGSIANLGGAFKPSSGIATGPATNMAGGAGDNMGKMPDGFNTNDWDARGATYHVAHGGMIDNEELSEDDDTNQNHMDVILRERNSLPRGHVGESVPALIEDDYLPRSHEYIRKYADGGMPQQQVPQYQVPQFPMQQPPEQYMQGDQQAKFMPASGVLNAQHGAIVPGHAMAPGDNYKNDVVHAMLSPDEVVVPRSIMIRPDAPERAKEFIKGLLAAKRRQR